MTSKVYEGKGGKEQQIETVCVRVAALETPVRSR